MSINAVYFFCLADGFLTNIRIHGSANLYVIIFQSDALILRMQKRYLWMLNWRSFYYFSRRHDKSTPWCTDSQ